MDVAVGQDDEDDEHDAFSRPASNVTFVPTSTRDDDDVEPVLEEEGIVASTVVEFSHEQDEELAVKKENSWSQDQAAPNDRPARFVAVSKVRYSFPPESLKMTEVKRGAGVLLVVTTEKEADDDNEYCAALPPVKFSLTEKEPVAEDETEKDPSSDNDEEVNVKREGLTETLEVLPPVDVLTIGTTVTFPEGR